MIGSSVALELARAGRSVIVVERGSGPGTGSTSASSSIIRYSYSTPDSILTAWEAAQMWFDWEGHLGCVDPDGMARFIECANLIFQTTGYDGTPILPVVGRVRDRVRAARRRPTEGPVPVARHRQVLPAEADRRPGLRRRPGGRADGDLQPPLRVHGRPDAVRQEPRVRGAAARRRVPVPLRGRGDRSHRRTARRWRA